MIEAFRLGALGRSGPLWEGVDLSFADGEVWIVAGPPSCGKSLLLRILRGERRPDAGDVVVGGESLFRGARQAAAFRASAGLVPESFSSWDAGLPRSGTARTVGDLFRLSALAAGAISAKERAQREEELMALVGLSDPDTAEGAGDAPRAGARAWELSSLSLSERARVALAAELLRNPRYLFADMLVANAGREWVERLGALFRALAREGRTIVVAERAVPERWQAARVGDPAAAGPFSFHRLGAPAPEPRKSDLEWLPDGPEGREGA